MLDEEIKLLKGDSMSIVIGGFDQGGAMAFKVALEYTEQFAAIMSWSGFYPPTSLIEQILFNERTPVFIVHGEKDKYLPWERAKKTYDTMDNMYRPIFL